MLKYYLARTLASGPVAGFARLTVMPSTVIRSIAYRSEQRALEVLFTTGRRYIFHDVPENVAEAFRGARIKGRFFNARVRGRYRFTECRQEEPDSID